MESGVIVSLFRSHGFIRSPTKPLDLFFHFKDIESDEFKDGELKVGLHVKFHCHEEAGKRAVARMIQKADASAVSIAIETISEAQYVGQVVSVPLSHTPGYIRFIPQTGSVAHLSFHPCDVVITGTTSSPVLQGSIVLFHILTDKRKEMMAERGGSSECHKHHASKKAVKIVPLPGTDEGSSAGHDAFLGMEPSMIAEIHVLKMMGSAFPSL